MSEKKKTRKDCPLDFKIRNLEEDPKNLYTKIEILGKGAYGEVFKVIRKVDGKLFAAKVIDLDDELGEVEKEIWFLQTCDHLNIIKGYDSFFSDSKLWIIMELCEGGSLSEISDILEKTMNEKQLRVIIKYTLEGLSYLHKMKRMHRDLKGGNILLNSEGIIKITDFGVSAQLSESTQKRITVIGTSYWIAPEVILQKEYDYSSDIWSLGITLLELAEGKPPLSGTHPYRALFLIPKLDPPKFKNSKKWSNEAVDFLSCCLDKDPSKRPSADDLLKHPWVEKNKNSDDVSILKRLIQEMFKKFEEKGGREEFFKWRERERRKKFDDDVSRGKKISEEEEEESSSYGDSGDSDSHNTMRKKMENSFSFSSSEDYLDATDSEDEEDDTLRKKIVGKNDDLIIASINDTSSSGEENSLKKKDLVSFHIARIRKKKIKEIEEKNLKKKEEKRILNKRLFNIFYHLSEQEFKLEEMSEEMSRKINTMIRIRRTKV